ncbi:collagen binding domain-containing protein [Paenibacillus yanchengensis]|uniref:Collagen binding domain-containing protein n=1 Tax=Paenibacillus yanchengensis TaxID=2035833 RepID=A0ABW4YMH6_9BACL
MSKSLNQKTLAILMAFLLVFQMAVYAGVTNAETNLPEEVPLTEIQEVIEGGETTPEDEGAVEGAPDEGAETDETTEGEPENTPEAGNEENASINSLMANANSSGVDCTENEALCFFLKKISFTVDGDPVVTLTKSKYDDTEYVSEIKEDFEFNYNEEVTYSVKYDWEILDGHQFTDGSIKTLSLPEGFLFDDLTTPANLEVTGPNGPLVIGTYTVINKEIIIEFNDKITDEIISNGVVTLESKMKIENQFEDYELNFSEYFDQVIKIPVKNPNKENYIDKSGSALPTPINSKELEWKININLALDELTNAKLLEKLPEGVSKPTSIEIKKINNPLDSEPKWTYTPLEPSKYTNIGLDNTDNQEFSIAFNEKLTDAYQITFKTQITDSTKIKFNNVATLIHSNDSDGKSDDYEVNITRSPLFKKEGKVVDNSSIEWTITYNEAQQKITNEEFKTIVDSFESNNETNTHQFDSTTFEVWEKKTGDNSYKKLPNHSPFVLNSTTDKTGFELSLEADVNSINSSYQFKYRTKPTDNTYIFNSNTDKYIITNTVKGGEESAPPIGVGVDSGILHKWHENIDYSTKSLTWRIDFNREHYDIKGTDGVIILTEKLPAGMSLIDNSLVVGYKDKNGENQNLPNVSFETGADGHLTLELPEGNSRKYNIEFKTTFENNEDAYDSNNNYCNTADMQFKHSKFNKEKVSATSCFNAHSYTEHNGFKETKGYDATTKTITWGIVVNYNSKTMNNVKVVDIMRPFIITSEPLFEIYELDINANGSISKKTTPLNEKDKKDLINMSLNTAEQTIDFNFIKEINKPYYIELKTVIDGTIPDDGKIKNKATISADGFGEKTTNEVQVNIPNAGNEITKQFVNQEQNNAFVANWSIIMNRAQSTIETAKIIDKPSDNQIVIRESIKVYSTDVDKDGNISEGSMIQSDSDLYKLNFSDKDNSFTIEFLSKIDRPFIIKYQTFIDVVPSASVTIDNDVELETTVDHSYKIKKPVSKSNLFQDNSAAGEYGSATLTIHKKDEQGRALPNVEFDLKRTTTGKIIPGKTDASGTLVFEDLKYSKYELIETGSLPYYDLQGDGKINIAIGGDTEVTVINTKKPRIDITVSKLGEQIDGSNEALAGAEFELYEDSNPNTFIAKGVTNAAGKLVFDGTTGALELYPDVSYTLKEVTAPFGYTVHADVPVSIDRDNNVPIVVTNKLLPYQDIVIYKVHEGNSNRVLEGAVFELLDKNNIVRYTGTSDINGSITFKHVPIGQYTLKETTAPSGYQLLKETIEITVTENDITIIKAPALVAQDQNTGEITVYNKPNNYPPYEPDPTPEPTPTPTPGGPEPTPSPTPGGPEPTPSPTPGGPEPTPSPTPGGPEPTPSPTPGGPEPTPTPTPGGPEPTPTPVDPEVEVPDEEVPTGGIPEIVTPPTKGKVIITPDGKWKYVPNPGQKGKDTFTLLIDGEEVLFEVDLDEIPRGGIEGEKIPNLTKLPKTGQDSYLAVQLVGAAILLAGIALLLRRRIAVKK